MKFFPSIVNTCHDCGEPCEGVYALHEQAALAGGGKCAYCAGIIREQAPPDATPAARKLAEATGVNLADVAAGLEPGKRVGKRDVEAYLKALEG